MESTLQQEVTVEQAINLGLREEEFKMIKEVLGRTPNFIEMTLFVLMRSELNSDSYNSTNVTENIRSFFKNELMNYTVQQEGIEPVAYLENKKFDIESVKQPDSLKDVAFKMLQLPFIAQKRKAKSQFDTTNNVISDRPLDATLISIEGSENAIALALHGNERYTSADPEVGTMIAFAEAARKIVCLGGLPSFVASTLKIEKQQGPESNWQIAGAINGLTNACAKFEIPVKCSRLVSADDAKSLSSLIGMIGIVEDVDRIMTLDFKQKGDLIFVIGESKDDISSSEYLASFHHVKASSVPYFDLEKEYSMQHMVKGLIQNELVNSVHDVSDGGIYVTLVEMSIPRELGFDIVTDSEIREDAFLFGEGQGRVVVTVNEDQEEDFIEFMMDSGVSFTLLGHVTKGKMMVDDEHFGFVTEAKALYKNA